MLLFWRTFYHIKRVAENVFTHFVAFLFSKDWINVIIGILYSLTFKVLLFETLRL